MRKSRSRRRRPLHRRHRRPRRRRAGPAPPRLPADAPHLAAPGPRAGRGRLSRGGPGPARLLPRGAAGPGPGAWPPTASTGWSRTCSTWPTRAAGRPALPPGRPRLGRPRGAGSPRPPSRTAPLAHRPVAASSGRVPPGVQGERRRSAAPLPPPPDLPRSRPPVPACSRTAPGGCAARLGRPGRGPAADRGVPLGARRAGRAGGGPGLVPGGRNPTAVEVGPVTVPTLYIWGDGDATVGPSAARSPPISSPGPSASRSCPAWATS